MTPCDNCIFKDGCIYKDESKCNINKSIALDRCIFKVTPEEYNTSVAYSLTDVEREKYNNFKSHHCGTTWLCFCPTGTGSLVHCYCENCHKTEDITDLDSW